ncbi:MAG: hypothetical protein QOH25_2016 [Acidobacteriota bacterium]|nr:hypothetical protein [Acidobacteriota bacterium]
MKHLRQLCLVFLMALALSIPAFAGEMGAPGVTGTIECGLTGDIQNGIAGDMPAPGDGHSPGFTGDIGMPGIVQFLLSLF